MTMNPYVPNPRVHNGPICPFCGRGYIQTGVTSTWTQPAIQYKPKHRKEGPAQ